MANTHTTLTSLFTEIANSIREKTGSTNTIVADTFPTEIANLRTGFDYSNNEITSIPDYAFYGCEDLNSVDCYNLTSIGTGAFENCKKLKSVILYEDVTSVGENAFKDCNENLIIYYKGTSIPDGWHEDWNPNNYPVLCGELIETWDVSATETDNVTAELYGTSDDRYTLFIYGNGNMKDYSSSSNIPWYSCCGNIKNAIVSNGVTSIGEYTFYDCTNLTSINIPDSVISIGKYAFSYCTSLTSINIPDSVTSISDSAFYGCTNLTSINIPNSVTSIGNYTFKNCTNLTSINIPNSVISISEYTFYNCESLISISYTGTIAQWNAITFCTDWNYNTPEYTITCTDGTIAKDGTITYYNT